MPPPPNERPRQPAAAARAINRNPLTPKVAAKGAPVASPLTRRPPSATPTVAHVQRDDVTTPVGGFLAANVTPRSGSRQSRAEITNITPSGTPNADRTSEGWEAPRSGLGIVMQYDGSPRHTDMTSDSAEANKFFYASDVKNTQQPQPRQGHVAQKGGTFFYANRAATDSNRSSSSTLASNPLASPPASNVQDPISSKFVYANGAPDLQPKTSYPSSSASVASGAPRMAQPARAGNGGTSAAGSGPSSRPTSPIKSGSSQSVPVLRPAVSPTSPGASQSTTSPPMLVSVPDASATTARRGTRRVSIDSPPDTRNRPQAGGNLPGNDSGGLLKLTLSPNLSEGSPPPLSPGLSQTSMTMASLLHAVDEIKDDENERDSMSEAQSPTKSQFSDNVSELVANARRERKVQDLEITNASLEAINRTLERQLRKQTAELRRFRRLSRSGRLSLNSAPPSRNVSAALTDPPVDLSDLSEEEEDSEEDDEEADSLEESDVSISDSGSVDAQSAGIMRRKRDEKRLQLDLTKHQELLIDSQKMNQSIKRCLNWTESLIKEGQKALEYNVRVSDIEFGGRVLAPPDDDEDYDSFQGDDTVQDPDATLEAPESRSPPDRDSGIELPKAEGG